MSSKTLPIPLSVPCLRGNEWTYIKECLDTNWVSYVGPFVDRFERELAQKTSARHAVATSSGTAALHVALLMAGVGREDEVVMPAISFVAPANAVRYCGAWPAFTDIRADDWQWDVELLADFLDMGCGIREGRLINKATGRRIAALMPVHLLGGMCDVDAVAKLAARYELPMIEDAAECLGASYKQRPIGGASLAAPWRLVTTSFNGNKIITTGGGGAIFTDDPDLAAKAKHLTTTAKADKIEFFHDQVGYNYRLTNVAAAIGVAQLEQLENYVEMKRALAARYAAALAGIPGLMVHPEARHGRSTFWMYTVMLDRPSRPVVDALLAEGIQSRPIWMPLPTLPAFADGYRHGDLSMATRFYRQALSLPCSVGLMVEEQERVIGALRTLCLGAART